MRLDIDAAGEHEIHSVVELVFGIGQHALAVVGVTGGVGCFNLGDRPDESRLLRRRRLILALLRKLAARATAAARLPEAVGPRFYASAMGNP